jgi:hypothetical protein
MASYERMRYWTTHNSYEGGSRGSLHDQLSGSVRSVELDVWDNDFERLGDYRLGHFKPGHAVATGSGDAGENPKTLFLRDWLKTIADWHEANDHAVLTIVLDLKSDLTDNETAGDLEDLNARLEEAFGDSLFTRDDFDVTGAWPDTAELRNRVICVLSGNSNNRASYRFCTGSRPAVAMQEDGAVVAAYRSNAGDMRYWSGRARLPRGAAPGRIDWIHKGTYAWSPHTVSEPSVAALGDGWFVSVYRIGPAPGRTSPSNLHATIGELGEGGRVFWRDSHEVGAGVLPSLEVVGPSRVRLVYSTPSEKSFRAREGTVDRKRGRIEWSDASASDGPAFARDAVLWKGHEIRVRTNNIGVVLCALDGAQRAIGYRQLMFVELQGDEDRAELLDPVFYGASASNRGAIARARALGLVARAWWFKHGDRAEPPGPDQENFAATDFPFAPWYAPYMQAGGTVEV